MIKETLDNNEHGKLNDKKIAVLKENFPNCFSGDTLDIEKFKKEINQDIDFFSEGYEMNFLGKNYAKYIADSIDTETVLKPDVEHNSKPENIKSENIYITGDNLDVLKHLRKSYSNKIKLIYIDPPYNIGGDDFVYNDNFNFTVEELRRVLDIEEDEAERLLSMTSSNSSSHSAWLTFMYPRLYLGRELLTEDGLILISIDDNEYAQLKILCDDIFGEENFIANFIRESRTNRENRKVISSRNDYVLCYSKNKDPRRRAINQLPMTEKALASYRNPDNDPRGLWKSDPATAQAGHGTKKQFYVLKAPNGKEHQLQSGRCWLYTKEVMQQHIEDGKIWFGRDGNGVPRVKTYLNAKERGLTPETIWFAKDISTNEEAKNALKELFDGKSIFDTPKPVELIKLIIQLTTDKNDMILDFFSGSSTTAHAVMEQNACENGGGNRKYIMVQLDEEVKDGSEAEKAGFKTIAEIGMERISRAAEHIKELINADIDYGFKHYYAKELRRNTIENIKEFNPNLLPSELEVEFDKETIMTTWMNQDGHGLTPPVKEINLDGYIGYYVNDYLYLIDEGLSQQHIDVLLSQVIEDKNFNPTSIILYGYNFTNFNILIQLETNLKQLRNEVKSIEVSLIKRY